MNRLLSFSLTICFFVAGTSCLHAAQSPVVLHPADVPVFFGITATELPADMRAELGASLPSGAGLGVTAVSRFGPAEDAGIRPADIILDVGNIPVGSKPELLALLQQRRPGEKLPVTVLRMGQRYELSLTLARRESSSARSRTPEPTRKLSHDAFDEIMRLQNLAAWQLARPRPDMARVLEALGRIRTLASGRDTGYARIYLSDGQGAIEIRGNEQSVVLAVGSPPSADTYRLDADTAVNPLPAALRQRLANLAQ